MRSSEVTLFVQALERLSFGGRRIRETIAAQSRILMFWYSATYLLLEKNKPKYQKLELLVDNGESENPGVQLDEAEIDQAEEPEDDDIKQPLKDQSQTLDSEDELDEIRPFVLEGL